MVLWSSVRVGSPQSLALTWLDANNGEILVWL